ncbi:uncharacterized protein LOC142162285 [Nicotiana tabacum]|uniref:Uncharacterized protein LOC142162285 n=1 Tax=Nicotiana tabacum TaxID=4097 RepID=A0AC58RPQ2_TOBAC
MNVIDSVIQTSNQLIHCHIPDKKCYGTFIYRLHTVADRKPMWDQLRDIHAKTNGPWIILGDFNSILSAGDRINVEPVHQQELADFQCCIDDIRIGQITKRRCQFSWSNKRDVEDRIYSHIDWTFGNPDWFQIYAGIEAVYMLLGVSDHSPIVLNTEGISMFRICRRLKMLEIQTKNIHKEYSSIDKKLENLRIKLETIQRALNDDYFNPILIEEEKLIIKLIENWDAVQERNNRITEPEQIQQEFINFFKKLLGEATYTLPGIDINIARDNPTLTLEQQQSLLNPVT